MADIQFDAFVDGLGSSYTHTCAGSNRILLFACRGGCVPNVNGVPARLLKTVPLTDALASSNPLNLFVFDNPLLGANAITFPNGLGVVCISASYKSNSQPIGLFEQQVDISAVNAASLTSTIVSSVNKCLAFVAEASYFFGGPPTAGAGLTLRGCYSTSINVPAIFDSNTVISPAGSFSGTTNQGAAGADITHIVQLIGPVLGKRAIPPIGVPTVLSGNVIYGMPVRAINIEYLTTGAAILEGSLDNGDNWITLDTAPGAGMRTINGVIAGWIRPSADVTVVFRKTKAKY